MHTGIRHPEEEPWRTRAHTWPRNGGTYNNVVTNKGCLQIIFRIALWSERHILCGRLCWLQMVPAPTFTVWNVNRADETWTYPQPVRLHVLYLTSAHYDSFNQLSARRKGLHALTEKISGLIQWNPGGNAHYSDHFGPPQHTPVRSWTNVVVVLKHLP